MNKPERKSLLPPPSCYLPLVLGGPYWRAQDSFKNIIIFGDSYNSYQGRTWVNHLIRELQKGGNSPSVYNFAMPGYTVEEGLAEEVSLFSTTFLEDESSDAVPEFDSGATTYIVFLGINDCGRVGSSPDALQAILEILFDTIHDLYVKAHARNFLLVDVPPIDRSPQAIDLECTEELKEQVKIWNKLLQGHAIDFLSTNATDATVFVFSSHKLFTDILNNPLEYEFTEDDPGTEGGGIWMDGLHPTSKVQDLYGEQLFASVFQT